MSGSPFFVLPIKGRLRPVAVRPGNDLSPFPEAGDKSGDKFVPRDKMGHPPPSDCIICVKLE